jgi:hypothetical protein
MRIDDLTRELRTQAEETRSWRVPPLRVPERRTRRRPQAVLVLVSVVAVAAILVGVPLVLGNNRGPDATAHPTVPPTPTSTRGAHPWTVVRCPSRTNETCEVPWLLELDGRQYSSGTGGRQPVLHGNVTSTDLSLGLRGPARGRLLLVGATRPGPVSHLVVRIGDRAPITLTGDLTLLPMPRIAGRFDVTITEQGTPGSKETLVIEEYRPVPTGAG